GWPSSQVVCAALVFLSGPLKSGQEKWLRRAEPFSSMQVPQPPVKTMCCSLRSSCFNNNNSPCFRLQQSTGDAPTTPKYTKEHRDLFFPAALPAPVLLTHPVCHPPPAHDGQARGACEPLSKVARPQSSGFHHDQPQQRRVVGQAAAAATAFLPPAEGREEPTEGLLYRQQESHLCQQMKLATVSQGQEPSAAWFQEEAATCSTTQPCSDQPQYASSEQSKLPDPSRIRARAPANMPKLFIPSTVTKFPPEITVTPPTPTLLSPKGSISEETKQRLKNVILSSQSAATVKKDTLTQPVLEVQETSSQESSLESESDEEDDYMDI
ncbi:hypothetical protein CCH79_00009798, partial [Gambusia affinis]